MEDEDNDYNYEDRDDDRYEDRDDDRYEDRDEDNDDDNYKDRDEENNIGEDFNEDEDDYFQNFEEDDKNQISMVGSFSDRERAGIPGMSEIDCEIYSDMKKNKKFLSLIEKFCNDVKNVTMDIINNTNPPMLSFKDLEILLKNMTNVKNVEYKNATGYVLGYYVADKNKINEERLVKTYYILNENFDKEKNNFVISDKSILLVDVIRYGRLWININKIK